LLAAAIEYAEDETGDSSVARFLVTVAVLR
jgi:hypothetical protein